jgi:hypothetical protein
MRCVAYLCGLVICVALGAEVAARLDDWIFDRTPIFANPTKDDLITQDRFGRHGRANARFKKWRLNNFGFRGPDINPAPDIGCRRIFILGASETFGLYESPDGEYPALLRKGNSSCIEIVNTAVVGMGLGAMKDYWQRLLKSFDPDEVLIYPSPLFYLSDDPAPQPQKHSAPKQDPTPGPAHRFTSRFVDRLHNALRKPDFLQIRIDKRAVEAQLAGKPPGWVYASVPAERLDAFQRDLDSLVGTINADGKPVALITHAIRFSDPDEAVENSLSVWDMRVFAPRASGRIMVEFNSAANERLRAVAKKYRAQVIDVASSVAGCHGCFGDLIHFTDRGASRVAEKIRMTLQDPQLMQAGNAVQ